MEPEGAPTQEAALAQWQQPTRSGRFATASGQGSFLLIALVLAVLLIGVAIWQRQVNYGLVGLVPIVAFFALRAQSKSDGLEVTVTNQRVIVGKRGYPLENLGGFWLHTEGDIVEINLEMKKRGLLPLTLVYVNSSEDEARQVMSQVLAEVEPRERPLGDRIGNYFRL